MSKETTRHLRLAAAKTHVAEGDVMSKLPTAQPFIQCLLGFHIAFYNAMRFFIPRVEKLNLLFAGTEVAIWKA